MSTLAILEIITLLADIYYKAGELEGLSVEEMKVRLQVALVEKRKRKADDLPDV